MRWWKGDNVRHADDCNDDARGFSGLEEGRERCVNEVWSAKG